MTFLLFKSAKVASLIGKNELVEQSLSPMHLISSIQDE